MMGLIAFLRALVLAIPDTAATAAVAAQTAAEAAQAGAEAALETAQTYNYAVSVSGNTLVITEPEGE